MKMKKKFLILFVMQFILSFGLVLPSYSLQQNQNIIAVTPKEAADLSKRHLDDIDFVILDIRTPGEYQSGHLSNSILMDFYSENFVNKIKSLDKTKTYLLYCRSGNRTGKSLELFRQMKFKRIYHMSNGIIGWKSEGLPVVK